MLSKEKLNRFVELVEKQSIERLHRDGLDCEANLNQARTHSHEGPKYTRVDIGTSGRYMVVNETGEIYGIKAYGVIHRGHYYGTLDTVDEYYWGDYRAVKLAKSA